MKIYFAGNTGHGKAGIHREKHLKSMNCNRLFSLFWMEDFYKNFQIWSENIPKKNIDKSNRTCNINNKTSKLGGGNG